MSYISPISTPSDRQQLPDLLAGFPDDIRAALIETWHHRVDSTFAKAEENLPPWHTYWHLLAEEKARVEANVWLRDNWRNRVKQISFAFRLTDDELGKLAFKISSRFSQRRIDTFLRLSETIDTAKANIKADKLIVRRGVNACKRLKISPASGGFAAAAMRYCDTAFWIRKLRSTVYPLREMYAREIGMIDNYASSHGVGVRRDMLSKADKWAQGTVAINPETNEPVSMADILASASGAYKARIIAKATGLRNLQDANGWDSAMITITCPWSFRAGKKNYRDTQGCLAHLRAVQKRIGTSADKDELTLAGLTVFQPHRDGTPHQHSYVIGPKADIERFYEIVQEKALHDVLPDEEGADEHRTDIEWENRSKGSLSSYALSYVLRLTKDTPTDPDQPTPSCEKDGSGEDAWYSLNHARRIGWFGLPEDYAWEASRRVSRHATGGKLAKLRKAAKDGDYAAWVELVGGIAAKRKDRPYGSITENRENRFGEASSRYIGAELFGVQIIIKG